MDSATRAALLAAMAGGPSPASVTAVTELEMAPVTAETRTNPPFVTSVSVLPVEMDNPSEFPPPENPGWAEPELATDREKFDTTILPDDAVLPVTPVTRKQIADLCGSPVLPGENPDGNAGNIPANLAALETLDLIARVEFLYAGKIGLKASGPVWNGPVAPPVEVLANLKERRLAVQAVLLARSHAAKTRRREPDSWSADDWLAYFHERAGIREYDGGAARLTAEMMALADCTEHWLRRNSPAPGGLENGCWQCGNAGTEPDGADPMTTRACRGGVFWIHPRCWADYDAAAGAAAKAALGAIIGGAT